MDVYVKGKFRVTSPKKPKIITRFASWLLLVGGISLLFFAAWPVVSWYFFVMPQVNTRIISPLASTFGPLVRANDDSYDPAGWFSGGKILGAQTVSPLKTYSLSIPKLEIDNAIVEVGGDLKKSLVAWPSSALPGSYGNNIVFGHSELPQLASPKNYSGIFTFLMDLKEGDDIFVDYDGVNYHYQVLDKKVVEADDISVLEQRFDTSYITLITCVPPGTLWKRGIIKAKLVRS
jgi:sortase A